MSNIVYPMAVRQLTLPILKSHKFNTIAQISTGGAETRIAQMRNPLWTFSLVYEVLFDNPNNIVPSLAPYTDYQVMRGFMLARQGQFDDFLFVDPTDNTVVNQTIPLVNDGAGNYYSPIQRNFGGQFLEDISDLNPLNGSGLVVLANGVSQVVNTNFQLLGPGLSIPGYSFQGMYLKWLTGSPVVIPAAPITASFSFYFRLRFLDDGEDLEAFMQTLWTAGGSSGKLGKGMISLVTSRPTLV